MPHALIDFPAAHGGRSFRRSYSNAVAVLSAATPADVLALLAEVDVATRLRGLHAVGFLSYEAAGAFDRAFRVRTDSRLPLAWFALFRGYDHAAPAATNGAVYEAPAEWSMDLSRGEYDAAIACTRAAIAEGRTYQVNLTTRRRSEFQGDARAWYESLRRAQGNGYHAFLDFEQAAILSASPELFFARRGTRIETRPMKGTRARGRCVEEDARHARELLESEKDRAENLMIVDLLRNDLGRIAETGTVEVPALFQLEQYRTVWQMTSTVQARLPARAGILDVLGALFPCGSVTGAPKISTMQIIHQLERSPREVYCGAIGVIEPGGDCVFNVPIRTVWIDRERGLAEYGVGSGVTWDSLPSAEYEELRSKSAILTESWPQFQLLETMRMTCGTVARLDRHIERARASASYFGFCFPEETVRAKVAGLARQHGARDLRVRLLLSEDGAVNLQTAPYEPATGSLEYAVADQPVDSGDRFLFHKTTRRAVFETALAARPDVFDVLLWNERGELTEFTRGNVVLELDGRRCTPPVHAGLLAGTFRQALLSAGVIEERLLYRSDLTRATRVWLINSVREWLEVRPALSARPSAEVHHARP